jgi:hypothetical protein
MDDGAYAFGFAGGHVEVLKPGQSDKLRWEP